MVIMLAAAMLFTGAVILGNHLRAEAEATDGVSAGDETTLPDFDASAVPDVIARAAVFGGTPGEAGKVPRSAAYCGQHGDGDLGRHCAGDYRRRNRGDYGACGDGSFRL